MAKSMTAPSTPRLSEAARHVIIPAGIVSTEWPRVAAKCAELGVTFDPWQVGAGSVALGKRKDGRYAATIGGIVLSIPRQVGKTFLVGMIVIALCLLYPGMTVLWTAHRTRTTTKTFGTLKAMTSRKAVKQHMMPPRNTNGEQEVRFRNGSVIMFGAREQGFGRGFDEVDVEVFDEAQILTEKALEDMVAATNQSRHPHGALLFFMGTPPRQGDNGDEFSNRREKALSGESEDMAYIEFSADEDARLDDQKQWAKANPSFPARTPVESMKRMRAQLTDDDSFRREALGIWPDTSINAPPVIAITDWDANKIAKAPEGGLPCYGVRYSPDGSGFAVSVALKLESGDVFVEVIDRESTTVGIEGVAQWLADRWRDSGAIVIDGKSHEGALIEALLEKGVPPKWIMKPSLGELATAYSTFAEWVRTGRITHAGQEHLRESVLCAARRKIGNLGGWGFQPNSPDGDVLPVESATLAVAGTVLTKRKPGANPATGRTGASARRGTGPRQASVR